MSETGYLSKKDKTNIQRWSINSQIKGRDWNIRWLKKQLEKADNSHCPLNSSISKHPYFIGFCGKRGCWSCICPWQTFWGRVPDPLQRSLRYSWRRSRKSKRQNNSFWRRAWLSLWSLFRRTDVFGDYSRSSKWQACAPSDYANWELALGRLCSHRFFSGKLYPRPSRVRRLPKTVCWNCRTYWKNDYPGFRRSFQFSWLGSRTDSCILPHHHYPESFAGKKNTEYAFWTRCSKTIRSRHLKTIRFRSW